MRDPKGVSLFAVVVTALVTFALLLVAAVVTISAYYYFRDTPASGGAAAKPEHVSLETQYDTALHEAGHVIEDYLHLPHRGVDETWVYTDRPKDSDVLGMTHFQLGCSVLMDEECLRFDAMTDLAGLAAEEILLRKKPPEVYQDKDRAGSRILEYCAVAPSECGECPPDSKVGDECMLKGLMLSNRSRLYERVKLDVLANRETIVALANLLFSQPAMNGRRRLTRAEIEAFLETHPLVDPSMPTKNKAPPP